MCKRTRSIAGLAGLAMLAVVLTTTTTRASHAAPDSSKQVALQMAKLWEDHIT
jgi:hypothetical protein